MFLLLDKFQGCGLQERCKADAGLSSMGCYAKFDADKRNVMAADNVTTGDNDRGEGSVGAPLMRRTTTTTTTTTTMRAAAVALPHEMRLLLVY